MDIMQQIYGERESNEIESEFAWKKERISVIIICLGWIQLF